MKIYEVRGMCNSLKGRWLSKQDAENQILHLEDMYGIDGMRIVEVEMEDKDAK